MTRLSGQVRCAAVKFGHRVNVQAFMGWISAGLLVCAPAWSSQTGSEATSEPRSGVISPPSATQPPRLVAPQIKLPLIEPAPLSSDPPALHRGKAAPPDAYGGALSRCESLADVDRRRLCREKLSRETPVRPPR